MTFPPGLVRAGLVIACLAAFALPAIAPRATYAASSAPRPARAPVPPRASGRDAARVDARALADSAFLAQYAMTRGFTLGSPTAIQLTPSGDAVLFLRSGPRSLVRDLWELDVASGREHVLLTAEQILNGAQETLTQGERARRERLRLLARGIASYELSEDGRRILAPLSGRLFVVERATGRVTEIRSDAGPAEVPHLSPDGAHAACVRSGDLYVTDLATGAERRLTRHESDTVTNGVAEFVAQEEMDRFDGYWWSPDSKRIVYERVDDQGVERLNIEDPQHPERPPVVSAYPRPGMKNVDVTLAVLPAAGGTPIWIQWDRKRYPYLCRVSWRDRAPLTLLVMNRAQTEEALLVADPETGATRAVLTQADPAWLELDLTTPKWLDDGSAFLWTTDRSGPRRLELHDANGRLTRVLSPDSLQVFDVLDADRAAGTVWVVASAEPTERQLWRLPLRPGAPPARRMSLEAGRHRGVFARGHRALVESVDASTGERAWIVRGADGAERSRLRSVAEPPPFMPSVEFTRAGRQGFRAAIVRPRDFDAGKRYPVLVSVYGGPVFSTVFATPRSYVLDQLTADQGFIVVSLDGRGTPGRGRAWVRAIRGDLVGPALADQVEGLLALGKRYPELDLSRVGIHGWSFGGYMAAMAVLRRPDVFRAAMAGAPVVDWRDYDTFYTERYLGLPETDPQGYETSSVLTGAERLDRPLLIVHGVADDNVYFMHTLKLCAALNEAGRPYELMPLLDMTHMISSPVADRRVHERTLRFFLRELGGPKPGARADANATGRP